RRQHHHQAQYRHAHIKDPRSNNRRRVVRALARPCRSMPHRDRGNKISLPYSRSRLAIGNAIMRQAIRITFECWGGAELQLRAWLAGAWPTAIGGLELNESLGVLKILRWW